VYDDNSYCRQLPLIYFLFQNFTFSVILEYDPSVQHLSSALRRASGLATEFMVPEKPEQEDIQPVVCIVPHCYRSAANL
jgi:hypothetical protein